MIEATKEEVQQAREHYDIGLIEARKLVLREKCLIAIAESNLETDIKEVLKLLINNRI